MASVLSNEEKKFATIDILHFVFKLSQISEIVLHRRNTEKGAWHLKG